MYLKIKIVTLIIFLFMHQSMSAQVRLPRLIRDSMILQRDAKVKIWGWASAKEKIKINFQNKIYKTTADANGKWLTTLLPLKSGGPYNMHIDATNHLVINNILVGDVWLCSGQSNMAHQMKLHKELYEDEIANANNAEIREFWIPAITDLQKTHDDVPPGYWKSANPIDVLQFSAVAYFFAKTIYQKYHVPIGIINSSVGGPGIEAWISEEGLKDFPSVIKNIKKNKDTAYINLTNRAAFTANANKPKPNDKGLLGNKPWYDTTFVPNGWRNINIPGYWEDQGIKDLDGIVWYRKEIDIPTSMTNIPATVFLGRIVDEDYLYINGKLVGNTTYQYPQRRYTLPADVLKPGKNIFVIRVINHSGKGGFVTDKPYYIAVAKQKIDLKGEWQYKVGEAFINNPNSVAAIAMEYQPTALYNAMIFPLFNYSIKGIVWYQGEGSLSNAADYKKLLPVMISDWRSGWKQNDIPFVFVQLPNFGEVQYLPSESPWAILRDAQLKTLSVANTEMAVAIDLGEWNDIHPLNKKDVGIRLALAAEHVAYGEKNIIYSGPIYQSYKTEGNKIIISFTNIGSGLITNDGEELSNFAIAGADKNFIWAKAKIKNDKIIVWNESISNPKYVRYAWADNPANANLYNKENLPASPFTTEN